MKKITITLLLLISGFTSKAQLVNNRDSIINKDVKNIKADLIYGGDQAFIGAVGFVAGAILSYYADKKQSPGLRLTGYSTVVFSSYLSISGFVTKRKAIKKIKNSYLF